MRNFNTNITASYYFTVLEMSNWQTNLRRSTGAPQQIGAVRKNLRKSDVTGQVSKSKNENTSKAAIKPRLKSVTETDDVFGDENEGNKIKIVPRENRKRLSTKGRGRCAFIMN